MLKLKLVVSYRNLSCPLCHEGLRVPDDTHKCEECGHLSHEACFTEFDTCGSFECFGNNEESLWAVIDGTRHRFAENTDVTNFTGGLEIESADGVTLVFWDSEDVNSVEEAIREDVVEYVSRGTLVNWALEAITPNGKSVENSFDEFVLACDTPEEQSSRLGGEGQFECPETSDAFDDLYNTWEYVAVKV